jgi:hypothetical protein
MPANEVLGDILSNFPLFTLCEDSSIRERLMWIGRPSRRKRNSFYHRYIVTKGTYVSKAIHRKVSAILGFRKRSKTDFETFKEGLQRYSTRSNKVPGSPWTWAILWNSFRISFSQMGASGLGESFPVKS